MPGLNNKTLEKIDEWGEHTEAPPELVEFYRRLLQIQTKARRRVGVPKVSLSAETVAGRLGQGRPLLVFRELDLDWARLRRFLREVASVFAAYPGLFQSALPEPAELFKGSLLKRAFRVWFEGKKLPPAAVPAGVSQHLLDDIIQAALWPFLAGYAKALIGLVNQESWRRGYCPVCGGRPDIAFLDRERGSRWLVCGRCDAQWLYQRLECPFCGNQAQKDLAYYTDDSGLYRLYVCEQCRQYLKTIDLRQIDEEVIINLERLFTLSLDAQAREQGYGN